MYGFFLLFLLLVVMKTSEITPLPLYKFAELVKEAGFPAVSKRIKIKKERDRDKNQTNLI